MTRTILPKKTGQETPIATNDDHHAQLASDPTINQFPQGSTFGSNNATNTFNGASTFGSTTTTGFGQTGGFSSSAPQSNGSFGGSPMGSAPAAIPQQNLTAGAEAAVKAGSDTLVENTNTDWINKKWRPMMGWMYMVTCFADFVVFPVLWSVLQAVSKGQVTMQWQPLTLQGAGLYHVAMGAVLGIAAYGRTKEKIEGASK